MASAAGLTILGLVTTILCSVAVIRLVKGLITPAPWLMYVAMGLGAFAISAFYFAITFGLATTEVLIVMSRFLWAFVLMNTSLFALGVLLAKNGNG